jgi:hypothetical protein
MPTLSARAIRKRFPKEQGILEGVIDEDAMQVIVEAQDDSSFQRVDENLETEYRCPCGCEFEWSGNPKPPTATSQEKK